MEEARIPELLRDESSVLNRNICFELLYEKINCCV